MKNLQNHIFSTTTCISKETMLKFINKQLSQKELHQVQTHLIDCDFCSEALEGMAHAKNPSILFTIDHQIDKRTQQKKPSITRIIMVAASVLLFVFGGYYTINNFNDATKLNENEISFQEPQKNAVENILPAQEELLQEQKEVEVEKTIQPITLKSKNDKDVVEGEASEKWITNYDALEESPIEQQVYRDDVAKDKTITTNTSSGNTYKVKVQDTEDEMMNMDNTVAPAPKIVNEKTKTNENFDQKTTNQLASKLVVSDNVTKTRETKQRAKKEMEAPKQSSVDDFKNRDGDEIVVKEEENLTRNENTSFAETISTTDMSGGLVTGSTTNISNLLANGIELYRQKKYTLAIQEFDVVLNGNDNATKKSEARWYKALCLIELKDIAAAKDLLTMLTQYNNAYSKKAEDKLKVLE